MGSIFNYDVKGCMSHCCRCGLTVFRKLTGEGVADGGFTRWDKFEPLPEGWEWHHDTGQLCAKCNVEYKDMIHNFMNPPDTEIREVEEGSNHGT